MGAWERSILWEEKIQQLLCKKFEKNEFNAMMLARLIEGLLITLVKQVSVVSLIGAVDFYEYTIHNKSFSQFLYMATETHHIELGFVTLRHL